MLSLGVLPTQGTMEGFRVLGIRAHVTNEYILRPESTCSARIYVVV